MLPLTIMHILFVDIPVVVSLVDIVISTLSDSRSPKGLDFNILYNRPHMLKQQKYTLLHQIQKSID